MVKHVVGGRNKQVLPQWKCHWCNIQFDNMGSVIFFECGPVKVNFSQVKGNAWCIGYALCGYIYSGVSH
jgi:hypothetical protein